MKVGDLVGFKESLGFTKHIQIGIVVKISDDFAAWIFWTHSWNSWRRPTNPQEEIIDFLEVIGESR